MINNNNIYKSNDILKDDFISRMNSFFNPYEYNFESNNKNNLNSDISSMKSKSHLERKKTKK